MKETFVLDFSISGVVPEESAPTPDRVLSGNPRFRTWEIDAPPAALYAGVWEATPGKWRVSYTEWEYFRVLSGVSILTENGAAARRLCAGDSLIIRPGFEGVWEVVVTTRKEYVIRL